MHRKVLGLAAVLLAALTLLPSEVDGQQKNQKNQKNTAAQATDQDYYLIQNQKALTGQVLGFDDANHTVSVRVDFPEWVPNPKYKANTGAQHALTADYNKLMQDQARLAKSRNPAQAQQVYNQMTQLQNKIAMDMAKAQKGNGVAPFMSIDHLKDFDLDLQDKIVYRKMFLTQEYDDTGNAKTYSTEELAKRRGNNSPKGSYAATAAEFHPGQGVWIYLSPPKKAGSTTTASSPSSGSDPSAAKEKELDAKATTTPSTPSVPRPTVKMLVIFKEGTVAPTTKDKNNPKKKKN